MQEGVLIPENEYGSKAIHDKLKRDYYPLLPLKFFLKFRRAEASQKADQVFLGRRRGSPGEADGQAGCRGHTASSVFFRPALDRPNG